MIEYNNFTLDNGLRVFVSEDHNTPMAVINILYNVGSKDESTDKTGFAHLFEHLMFGGSAHIASYDGPLQQAGGQNNAFTSPDITNYYLTIPANNLETGFWLESDRMLALSFDPNVLEVQQKVVIEEFKQRYLNQPYGDVWLKMRPLAYQVHPYRWPTIGREIAHIAEATIDDVRDFFYRFYLPNNAVMVVAGNVKTEQVKRLSEKWFGPIPAGKSYQRQLPSEPVQKQKRTESAFAKVPLDAVYMAYHIPGRLHKDYYAYDLLSDLLGRGQSSRLYQKLVKEKQIFNSVSAYQMASVEPGLLMIEGKLNHGYKPEEGENQLLECVNEFISMGVKEEELEKVKNQAASSLVFSEVELLNRAMNLAFFANLGNPRLVNEEMERIESVTQSDILRTAKEVFREENSSVLFYHGIS